MSINYQKIAEDLANFAILIQQKREAMEPGQIKAIFEYMAFVARQTDCAITHSMSFHLELFLHHMAVQYHQKVVDKFDFSGNLE